MANVSDLGNVLAGAGILNGAANFTSYSKKFMDVNYQGLILMEGLGITDGDKYEINPLAGNVVVYRQNPIAATLRRLGEANNGGFVNLATSQGLPAGAGYQATQTAYRVPNDFVVDGQVLLSHNQASVTDGADLEEAINKTIDQTFAARVNAYTLAELIAGACNYNAGSVALNASSPTKYAPSGLGGMIVYNEAQGLGSGANVNYATSTFTSAVQALMSTNAMAVGAQGFDPSTMCAQITGAFWSAIAGFSATYVANYEAQRMVAAGVVSPDARQNFLNGYVGHIQNVACHVVNDSVWQEAVSYLNVPASGSGQSWVASDKNLGASMWKNIYGMISSAKANTRIMTPDYSATGLKQAIQSPYGGIGLLFQFSFRMGASALLPQGNCLIVGANFSNPASSATPVIVVATPTKALDSTAPTITAITIGGVAGTVSGTTITVSGVAPEVINGQAYLIVNSITMGANEDATKCSFGTRCPTCYYAIPVTNTVKGTYTVAGAITTISAGWTGIDTQVFNGTTYNLTYTIA